MWAYLTLPGLQVERLQQLQPELASQPVVLYTEAREEVVEANAIARELGIQPGTSLTDSWLLAAELQVYRWRPGQQRQLLQQLATDLYQVFADICLDVPTGLWLHLTPMLQLYPRWQDCEQQLICRLEPWQLTYQLGFYRTPLAARLLACSGLSQLADVPVTYLPCAKGLQQQLQRMGLTTIGAVQAIPRALLGRRLGQELVLLMARLQGEQQEVLTYFRPPEWFYQRLPLTHEMHHWQALRFPVRRLLQELEHYLELRQQQTRSIQLLFYHRDTEPTILSVGMAHGSYLTNEMLRLCQLKAEHLQLTAPVLEVALQARHLKSRAVCSRELWEDTGNAPADLGRLLNELELRLGQHRVQGLQIADSWLPEESWQASRPGTALGEPQSGYRPVWLLSQPAAVRLSDWQLKRGPERLALPWWQGLPTSERDYWLALNQQGQWGWLFYDHYSDSWWLHGWFS